MNTQSPVLKGSLMPLCLARWICRHFCHSAYWILDGYACCWRCGAIVKE